MEVDHTLFPWEYIVVFCFFLISIENTTSETIGLGSAQTSITLSFFFFNLEYNSKQYKIFQQLAHINNLMRVNLSSRTDIEKSKNNSH